MHHCLHRAILTFTLWLAIVGSALAHADRAYTVAVDPRYTAVDIGRRWTPLLERLQQQTGIALQLRLSKNMADFEAEFMAGLPDIVYLNPYQAVLAHRAQGYLPFLRGDRQLQGILVVERSSPVRRLADLDGKRLVFPSANAYDAPLYLQTLLKHREGLEFTPYYVGNHQNVYRHVMLGDAVAGGGINSTLSREPAPVRNRLRVLYATPHLPSYPLAAHPRVPAAVRDHLAEAVFKLHADPEGRRLLGAAELGNPIRTEYAGVYAPLEGMPLDRQVEIPGTQAHP